MARWALYVDPTTGGFVTEDGTWRRCNPGIMAAVNAVLTEKGSVPGNEEFGADPDPTHLGEFAKRDLERITDKALRPLRGLDFDDFEREVDHDPAGNLTRVVRVFSGNAEDAETVPVE